MRLGSGPAGIILGQPDLTILTAVLVAAELYEISIPVLLIDSNKWATLQTGEEVSISAGAVSLSRSKQI
jgi:predicted aconitase with swiveling domain